MPHVKTVRQFVFDGLLLIDDFKRLRAEGIEVDIGSEDSIVDRIEETGFSPRIVASAKKWRQYIFCYFASKIPRGS